jgi:hypothetical protein
VFFVGLEIRSIIPFVFTHFLILLSFAFLTPGDRSWRAELEQGMTASLS